MPVTVPDHTSACITLFDQDKGLLFAADTLMPGGVVRNLNKLDD